MTRRGVDISSNNPHPIDWHAVYNSGIDMAWVKLSEATRYVNPFAAQDAADARAAGLEVWLYHFAGIGSPTTEADYFLQKAIGIACDGLCLDYEPPTPVRSDWVRTFLDRSGAKMLYSNDYRLKQMTADAKRGVRLWSAAYVQNRPATAVDAWQYTDKARVPGITGEVDSSYVYFEHPIKKVDPLFSPPWKTCDVLITPSGNGCWLLQPDGGVATYGDAPFYGSAAGQLYFLGRIAARLTERADGLPGYTIVSTANEKYSYPS